MSTTKMSRGKPVTLAKSASGEPVAAKAVKDAAVKEAAAKNSAPKAAAKQAAPKAKPLAGRPDASAPAEAPSAIPQAAAPHAADPAFAEKWNDLVKAQSEAALAWWQDAKDARTIADAIAVNARHSRVQFELAAGQAREMAAYFQKTFEGNAERLRSLLTPDGR